MSVRSVPAAAERACRPIVRGTRWAVATSHPLASLAGARVLERGGNAVDAVLAIAAVLAVVEPHAAGLGGDLIALVAEGENGRIWAIDGSGSVPPESTLASEPPFPERGPQSVAVPAAARAWQLLHERWGTLPLDVVLAPAIELAAHGVPVGHTLAASVAAYRDLLAGDPSAAAIFLPGGAPLVPGAILRQPWHGRSRGSRGSACPTCTRVRRLLRSFARSARLAARSPRNVSRAPAPTSSSRTPSTSATGRCTVHARGLGCRLC